MNISLNMQEQDEIGFPKISDKPFFSLEIHPNSVAYESIDEIAEILATSIKPHIPKMRGETCLFLTVSVDTDERSYYRRLVLSTLELTSYRLGVVAFLKEMLYQVSYFRPHLRRTAIP